MLTAENAVEWTRKLPVTASLTPDLRSVGRVLLRAVGDLNAGVAAEQPGSRDHGRGREGDQSCCGNDPTKHGASLIAFGF
jgi:hypothetical protein